MKRAKRLFKLAWLFIILFLSFLPPVFSQQQALASDKQSALAGRIGETEGNLLRFVRDSNDWVVAPKDTPVHPEEAFYTDEKGKAEFTMPNDTLVRIGDKTQIQLVKIDNDLTEMNVASGLARLVNKSASATLKAITPFGSVGGPPGTIFDVYVGDESIEIVSLKGKVEFSPKDGADKHEVTAGEPSLLSDGRKVEKGNESTDAAWNSWNEQRDRVAISRQQPPAEEKHPALVGRISETEGNVLRFVSDDNDWVLAVKDTPFRAEEAFYTDETGRAEFVMPCNTMVRAGDKTQIQLTKLQDDLTEIDIPSGVARFMNNNASATLKATTPFGYVIAPGDTVFDLYVGDESLEILSLKGKVTFIPPGEAEKYDVVAGESSLLSDGRQTGLGSGSTDAAWNVWNDQRDGMRNTKLAAKSESAKKMPAELKADAPALEENGDWVKIRDGKSKSERTVWKPTHVRKDWAPFTEGRWTNWEGDECWVPAEPFGYVTHHYGDWVLLDGSWYWSPPAVTAATPVAADSTVEATVYWNPGRVGWLYSDEEIGWFPLAPAEPYYSADDWGPDSAVADASDDDNVDMGGYAYADQAVVVNQASFYSASSYTSVNIRHVNAAAMVKDNGFKAKKTVGAKALKNAAAAGKAHNFSVKTASLKPDKNVTDRAKQTAAKAHASARATGKSVAGKTAAIRPGNKEALKTASVPRPRKTEQRKAETPKGTLAMPPPPSKQKIEQASKSGPKGDSSATRFFQFLNKVSKGWKRKTNYARGRNPRGPAAENADASRYRSYRQAHSSPGTGAGSPAASSRRGKRTTGSTKTPKNGTSTVSRQSFKTLCA